MATSSRTGADLAAAALLCRCSEVRKGVRKGEIVRKRRGGKGGTAVHAWTDSRWDDLEWIG